MGEKGALTAMIKRGPRSPLMKRLLSEACFIKEMIVVREGRKSAVSLCQVRALYEQKRKRRRRFIARRGRLVVAPQKKV